MADIRVNALPTIGSIAAEDILHLLDASTSNDVDSQTTVDAIADWIIANKDVRISGISDVPGLQAALDLKSNVGHTHIISEVTGLQTALDAKTDVTQAQIIGRNIVLNGKSINVPSTIGGLQDDRIPDTVVVGEYLQFGTTSGGINNITGDALKGDLALNLVDNTSDATKPISTATQAALDLKVGLSTFNSSQSFQDTALYNVNQTVMANTAASALNTAKVSFDSASSTKLAGIESGADVTDTTNVWSSLGISSTGSTGLFLTQRGVFAEGGSGSGGSADSVDRQPGGFTTAPIKFWSGTKAQYEALTRADDILYNITDTEDAFVVTKTAVDEAIGSGANDTDYYASDKTWQVIPTGADGLSITSGTSLNLLDGTTVLSTVALPSGGAVSKSAVDIAIGASASGSATNFYNEQGNFVAGGGGGDADSIDNQNGTDPDEPAKIKIWTGTKAEYDVLTPDDDVLYQTSDDGGGGSSATAEFYGFRIDGSDLILDTFNTDDSDSVNVSSYQDWTNQPSGITYALNGYNLIQTI